MVYVDWLNESYRFFWPIETPFAGCVFPITTGAAPMLGRLVKHCVRYRISFVWYGILAGDAMVWAFATMRDAMGFEMLRRVRQYCRWPCYAAWEALNYWIEVPNCQRRFFHILEAIFIGGSVYHASSRLTDLNVESCIGQYWLNDLLRYSFFLNKAPHLGLWYSKRGTGSYHFAQRLFWDVNHNQFEDIILVETTPLRRFLQWKTLQSWRSAIASFWSIWSGRFRQSPHCWLLSWRRDGNAHWLLVLVSDNGLDMHFQGSYGLELVVPESLSMAVLIMPFCY